MNIFCDTRCKIKSDYHLENGFINGVGITFETLFKGYGIENGKVIYLDASGFSSIQLLKVLTNIAVNIKSRKSEKTCLYVENTKLTKDEIIDIINNIRWEIYNNEQ